MNKNLNQTSRRDFVKTASVSAGLIGLSAKTALTADANSALQLGVIGCGGRGTSDANNFIRSTNTRVVAIADFFQDRLDAFQENIGKRQVDLGGKPIENSRKYKGMQSHKELLQSDVDMILITSPPYFHPIHLEATIEAGKHVYMEKPVGVDVVSAKQVMEIGINA
jgi:predicted dehydrogenase